MAKGEYITLFFRTAFLFCKTEIFQYFIPNPHTSLQIHQDSLITPRLFLLVQNQNVLPTVPAFLLG